MLKKNHFLFLSERGSNPSLSGHVHKKYFLYAFQQEQDKENIFNAKPALLKEFNTIVNQSAEMTTALFFLSFAL